MEEKKKGGFEAPGTLVLALIFLAVFVVFYFLNWKWLSTIWHVG